ncbi:DUF167 domain-containing protein [Acidihalobacter ferrooxydans]|uniref:UPF0235 protein BW247_11030 n=1 Tax=Acidihalobacter ferrooxydans TaxID=1765967 RepID=A0A1P8UI87_9GAMM|nr:DUF167 family protein [Acidihalobacter ferrooxydans]APZ43555.1 hypothetical protein BW247_11030 [Acidihalobacter ferrooxydans]
MCSASEHTWCRWKGDTLCLRLRVRPRASRTGLGEAQGDQLKLYLNAPPVDGKANAALVALLADLFHVPKSRILIRRGEHGRVKEVEIVAPCALPSMIPRK